MVHIETWITRTLAQMQVFCHFRAEWTLWCFRTLRLSLMWMLWQERLYQVHTHWQMFNHSWIYIFSSYHYVIEERNIVTTNKLLRFSAYNIYTQTFSEHHGVEKWFYTFGRSYNWCPFSFGTWWKNCRPAGTVRYEVPHGSKWQG